MDIAGMMGAMQNPQASMMMYAVQGMIQQHPNEWQQCQQMFGGKSRGEQMKMLRKLYKDRGMDLDATAQQMGVRI